MENQELQKSQEGNPEKAKQNIRLFLFSTLAFLGVVLVLAGVVGVVRVYASGATDIFSVTVAKVLRLPVAKVNGTPVLFSDYADDLKAIKVMREYDKNNNGPTAGMTDEQLSDQVLWRLANNVLVNEAAKKFSVRHMRKKSYPGLFCKAS